MLRQPFSISRTRASGLQLFYSLMLAHEQPRWPRLGAAHVALSVVTLLSTGWLQSGLTPPAWGPAQVERLLAMRESVAVFRFASLAYLFLTVLFEWRLGVALRRGWYSSPLAGWLVLVAQVALASTVAVDLWRGPNSRVLLADLEEWLAVMLVVASLAAILQLLSLRIRPPIDAAQPGSNPANAQTLSTRRLAYLAFALALAAALTVAAMTMLETRPATISTQRQI